MNDLKDFMGCNTLVNDIREGNLDAVSKIRSDIDRSPLEFMVKIPKYNNRTAYSFAANASQKRFDLLLLMPYEDGFYTNFRIADDQNRTPLMYAVSFGDSEAIHYLTGQNAASLSRVDKDGRNLLHLLCLPGDWSPKIYSTLDKNNISPSNSHIHQLKADYNDFKKGAAAILMILGVPAVEEQLRAKDRFGMTPIDYAAGFGFSFLITIFEYYTNRSQPKPNRLPKEVTVFGRDALQRYILWNESNNTYKDWLPGILINYDVRTPNPENGNMNAIQLAYLYNKAPDFIALLEADLISKDPKGLLAQDITGAMALHYAAQANAYNSVDCIKRHLLRLKQLGILNKAINHKDNEGRTASHVLVMTHTDDGNFDKQLEAYSCLLTYGAEVFPVDNNGHTPYDLAKLYGNHKLADAISKLASPKLLDPPKQNLKDYLDRDFIIRCVLSGNLNLQDYLKEQRFVEAINAPVARYGKMAPLHFVAQALKHQTQLAKILIEQGAKVDQLDVMQRAPIFYAANLQDMDLISLYLLQKPELRDAVDKDGRNLLHAFCMGGLFKQSDPKKVSECLDFLLLKYSTDAAATILNTPDNFGVTAAMYGIANKYEELYPIFLKFGVDVKKIAMPTDQKALNALSKDFYGFNSAMQDAYKGKDPDFNKNVVLQKQTNPQWGGDNAVLFWNEWYFKDNNELLGKVENENIFPFAGNASGSRIPHLKIFAAAHNPYRARSLNMRWFTDTIDQLCDYQKNTPLHVLAMTPKDAYPGSENGKYFIDTSKVLSADGSNPTVALAKQLINNNRFYGYAKNAAGQTAFDVAMQYGNNELADYILGHMLQQEASQNYSFASGCLQFGYNSVKKLAGIFTVNSTATHSQYESDSKDSNRRPLLEVTKNPYKF